MAGWDDVSAPVAPTPQSGGDWDSVSSPLQQPKTPDMAGVQKSAQDNLAANDNKESPETTKPTQPLTPQQRLDTATGLPVQSVLSGSAKPTDITPQMRKHYVDALNNGSAVDGPDFMQSMLHSVAPIAAGLAQRATHPIDTLEEAGEDVVGAVKGGAALLEYPFLSEASKEELRSNGTFPPLTDYQNPNKPTATESVRRGIELEQATVGHGMGGLFYPMAALSPVISPIIQSTGGEPQKPGETPTWQSLIPGGISVAMDLAGGFGLIHGAGELSALRADRARGPLPAVGQGAWDNHPGSDPIKEVVAKQLGKDPSAVTSADIDQTIAQGSKELYPADKDFEAVSTVTGVDEKALKNVYAETNKRPDEVFADAQHDPSIIPAIESGKIPPAYEHLVAPKPEPTPEQVENLKVVRSDTEKTFNVVDKDGDHVQGGFDSAAEAQHYIDDKAAQSLKDEPQEWKEAPPISEKSKLPSADATDPFRVYMKKRGYNDEEISAMVRTRENPPSFTPVELAKDEVDAMGRKPSEEGRQSVIPGAERISEKALEQPKPKENIYAGVEGKVDSMTQEQRDLRLDSLDKKLESGIITPKEQGEREALSARAQSNWSTKEEVGLFNLPQNIERDSAEHQAYADSVYNNRINRNSFSKESIDDSNTVGPKTIKTYPDGLVLVKQMDNIYLLKEQSPHPVSGTIDMHSVGTLKATKRGGVDNFSIDPEYRGKGYGQDMLKAADDAGINLKNTKDRSPSFVKALRKYENSKTETPAQSPFDHKPTEREIPADNYSKSLKEYSPVMYRETSANGALELLPYSQVATDVGEVHLADTTDMATGQGKNKGVMIAFDTDGLKGARNRSKPTADMSYSQGFGEYLGKHNKQSDYQKSVSAVRVSKDAVMTKTEKAMLSRTLKTLEEKGWKKTETDKYTEYTKPKDATELDVAGKQGEQLAAANEGRLKPNAPQKAASEGLFDVAGRKQQDLFGQKPKGIIPPSEIGKPTSLRTFLSNNGAKFNEANELISIKRNGEKLEGEGAIEHAEMIAKEFGYLPKDDPNAPSQTHLANVLTEKNGGREAWREQDENRVLAATAAKEARRNLDPAKIEHEAHLAGIDTDPVKGESEKQRIKRLTKELTDFWRNQEGSGVTYRNALGQVITAAEKFTGKLTGGLFEKLGDAYIKTFQPELVGPLAKRADSYLAKFKASGQEAENAYYRQSAASKAAFDKLSTDERMQWLYDHETGRWNEEDDPDHARYQALLDATFNAEKESIGGDPDKGYKENYLPHAWENPDAVKDFFNSDAMIKKYGKDGFTKASTFQLIQDGVRAGFKLKTDNPESMLVSRLLAGQDMIRTMNLLHDMESSGIAKPATAFSIDKRIGRTQSDLDEAKSKYQAASDKINDPKQQKWDFADPAVSRYMANVENRINDLQKRLEGFEAEKASNKLSSEQMKELKNGLRIIGPDSKAWNIHQQAVPLWKNAMEMKGLWENQGVTGDAYRTYMQGKAIWTQVKLGLSLFHPVHVAMIDLSSDIAATAEHLIQGGKLSELATKESVPNFGLSKETLKGQDHPAIQAWNTPKETRTPEQQQMVSRMIEGGFKPTMSARDTVHFRENFDKAVNGVGLNNLRLIGTAVSLPGLVMKPFFEHWIPGMKAEIYLNRYKAALARDPSLVNDVGRRGEMARQIAKDTDHTYGEMNQDVQFWNKNVKDSFNAAFISGGWKLAQIYNARGLLQPAKIAYKFAKTGEFSKSDITYNMLHAYAYTGLTLALGGAINAMLGNPIGTAKDTVWDIVKNLVAPQTGEKNPDGTPIRLNQPAFAKEAYNLAHEINTRGLLAGTGSFLYHQTLMPGIVDTLTNRDFTGKKEISDPTDLHQWMNAGWDAINPISTSNYAKAEAKGSEIGKIAGVLGFPLAGAYLNQTPFEQKIISTYDEQNPPKGDAYQARLKADLKLAIANKDIKEEAATRRRMKEDGMTDRQISNAEKPFTKSFVDIAWKKLPIEDQKRLIDSASEEEKKKFRLKSQ